MNITSCLGNLIPFILNDPSLRYGNKKIGNSSKKRFLITNELLWLEISILFVIMGFSLKVALEPHLNI